MQLKLKRPITKEECEWLSHEKLTKINSGVPIYECAVPTHGVIGPGGIAATFDPEGGYPFFELPEAAIEIIALA